MGFYIKDAVDINEQSSDFISTKDSTQELNDSAITYSTVDLRHRNLKIFSLLTTSDKEINLRMYPDQHVEDMCKKHTWTTPFPKPLQSNHDIFEDANARFYDSWYLKHADLKPQHGYGKLPQGVIDEFEKRGAFKEGTASTIGMAETADLNFKTKIIDGTYWTTSQGANTDSLTCNICGKPYYDWKNCSHSRGTTYPIFSEDGKSIKEMKTCIPYTGPLTAVEDSVVNSPANDTSTLLVYDMKKDRVVTLDNVTEYGDLFTVLTNNDNKNIDNSDNKTKPVLNDDKKNTIPGLTPEQIAYIQKQLDEKGFATLDGFAEKPNEDQQTLSEEKKPNLNNDNKNEKTGGKMGLRDTAKIMFKKEIKDFGIEDATKIETFFDKLTDEAVDTVFNFLDFIAENKVVVPVKDDKEPETKPTTNTTDKEQATKIEDTEEFKNLQAQLDSAKQELAKLKGLDNTVPDLSDIQDKENKDTKQKRNSRFL